ncbi:Alpha/Beta hydrolase protein [Chaetomium fimeti]|uniref:Alpha/Beta hydrolase protein n=1 Tax=Chaetomium fimeti TaxID=1854472 RepID=A0AAE0HDD6_9PEZI|nr:Alpha/Beta hydrolase protein [Chaetomium fimeti]
METPQPTLPPAIRDFPTITISPTAPATHTHTVIFLHGRGDNTKSFTRALHNWYSSLGTTLFAEFPTIRWVFPQAPLRTVASTADQFRPHVCPQWFDVWTPRDFAEREEVQLEGLRETVPAVRALLAREAGMLGGRWDRVVLAGISMGAASGVHTLLNLEVPAAGGGRLAAFMGFCARCPFAGRDLAGMREVLAVGGAPPAADNAVLRATPILLEHSAGDPLVLIERGRGLRDTLRGFGAQVEWKEYEGGAHWFHEPEGLDDVIEFLRKVVLVPGKVDGAGQGGPAVAPAEPEAMDLS